jgi:hypothetical protein
MGLTGRWTSRAQGGSKEDVDGQKDLDPTLKSTKDFAMRNSRNGSSFTFTPDVEAVSAFNISPTAFQYAK